MKLAAIRVFVAHLDEAAHFYENVLGFRVGARAPEVDYFVFDIGACDLIVERVTPDAPAEEQALVGRFTGVSFNVKDIASTCDDLISRGVQVTEAPERQPWGGSLATFKDPAGNEIQLVEYPSAA